MIIGCFEITVKFHGIYPGWKRTVRKWLKEEYILDCFPKISVIKKARTKYGWSLMEAKQRVESQMTMEMKAGV